MNDATLNALHGMLRGLAARQRAINDNIANVETPNYTAKRVEFEDALRSAIESGQNADVAPHVLMSQDPALPNGNNVSVDKEIVAMQDTGIRYQLAIEAVNAKLSLLRTSIKGAI